MEHRMTDIERQEWEEFGQWEYHGMLCDYCFKDENLGYPMTEQYYKDELDAKEMIDIDREDRIFW